MSLINQVLKDLEQRRENPTSSVDGSIVTMPRYIVTRRGDSFVVYVFGAVLIILSLLVGFLVWDRQAHGSPSPAVKVVEISAPVSVPAASLAVPGRPKNSVAKTSVVSVASPAPAVAGKKTLQTREWRNKPEKPPIKMSVKMPAPPAPVSEVKMQREREAERGSVEKQQRPLTKKQLTDQAFQQGYAALRKDQVQQAETFFRKALASTPGHIKSREMLAGIYIKVGRYVEAAQLLKRGLAINPGHSMFRKLYARVLLEQGALDQAVGVLEHDLPPISQDVDYYALLAALYQRQGRHKNAVAVYRNLLKQNSRVGIWWIGMGISLEKLGDSEAARQAYKKARASGTLAAQMIQYTDNRLAALNEIGYPDE